MPAVSAVLHNLTTIGVCLNAMRPAIGEPEDPGTLMRELIAILSAPANTKKTSGEAAAERLVAAEDD